MLLSLGDVHDKCAFQEQARILRDELRPPIYATEGRAEALGAMGIPCERFGNRPKEARPSTDLIGNAIDPVINFPVEYDEGRRPDAYFIRRRAVDANVPLLTDPRLARPLVEALRFYRLGDLRIVPWHGTDISLGVRSRWGELPGRTSTPPTFFVDVFSRKTKPPDSVEVRHRDRSSFGVSVRAHQ